MFAWGNKHLTPEGKALLLTEREAARPLDPIMVDAVSRAPLTSSNVALVPGPRANPEMRERLASIRALRPDVLPYKGYRLAAQAVEAYDQFKGPTPAGGA